MAGYEGVTAFLLCAWEELLDHNTPDSYQPRLLHSFALLEELAIISRWALRSERWKMHLPFVTDELVQTVKYENEVLKRVPGLPAQISALCDISDPATLESSARVMLDTTPQFKELIREALIESVSNLPKKKKSAAKILRLLATEALRVGSDAGELKAICSADNLIRNPEQIAQQLMASFEPVTGSCRCIFSIEGRHGDIHSILRNIDDFRGFRFLNADNKPADAAADEFFSQYDSSNFLELIVENATPAKAARFGSFRLRRAFDVFNFYQSAISLNIADETLVVEPSGRSRIVRPSDRSSRLVFSRRNSRKRTREVLSDLGISRLEGRLINALEHHTLAHTATDPKIKLVNLWSALECLVGPGDGSVADRVVEAITPIIIWRRVDKLARYLAIYLHRFGFCRERRPPNGLFRKSTSLRVSVEEILIATARPKDHSEILALLDTASPHPLLRFRVYRTWELMTCPKRLAQAMEDSAQRLRWHIFRIYRACNLIVHHGEEVSFAQHLFDNVQSCSRSLAISGSSL